MLEKKQCTVSEERTQGKSRDEMAHLLDPLVAVLYDLLDRSVGGRRVVLVFELERDRRLGALRLVEQSHRDGRRLGREADAQREREIWCCNHVGQAIRRESRVRGGKSRGDKSALSEKRSESSQFNTFRGARECSSAAEESIRQLSDPLEVSARVREECTSRLRRGWIGIRGRCDERSRGDSLYIVVEGGGGAQTSELSLVREASRGGRWREGKEQRVVHRPTFFRSRGWGILRTSVCTRFRSLAIAHGSIALTEIIPVWVALIPTDQARMTAHGSPSIASEVVRRRKSLAWTDTHMPYTETPRLTATAADRTGWYAIRCAGDERLSFVSLTTDSFQLLVSHRSRWPFCASQSGRRELRCSNVKTWNRALTSSDARRFADTDAVGVPRARNAALPGVR